MNERLLQFIWQFQHYNHQQLFTDEGEVLQIINPGSLNYNQGPDFLNASARIGSTTWVGNIELHVRSSDWDRHRHTTDPNYRNVILHVVWENDQLISQASTLSLKERVSKLLLNRYEELMHGKLNQACRSFLPAINQLAWLAWKERLLAERLERKAAKVLKMLDESRQHWEEVLWWTIAGNFGIKVNVDCFEAMARSVPVNLLAKHKHQLIQLEAILLGQANLLNGHFEDDYPQMLQREYQFLKKKYELKPHQVLPHFLRMRPANFPSLRLAQLAALVSRSSHLFSAIKDIRTVKELKELLNVTANDYWHYHYRFDEPTVFKKKHLGSQMIDNIVINSIAPVLFAYGLYTRQEPYKDKAIHWLQQVAAEQNAITRYWASAEVANHSAFDSQALIELSNNYCNHQRCLECAVGNRILQAR